MMNRRIAFILLSVVPLWAWSAVPTAVNDTTPEALYRLGHYYLRGNDSLGIYMNKEKGVELIRRSAELGYFLGQFQMAAFYEGGLENLSQDYTQVAYWSRKAAEQGDSWGQCKLGLCYANGQGVSLDY